MHEKASDSGGFFYGPPLPSFGHLPLKGKDGWGEDNKMSVYIYTHEPYTL